ncbi:hypothetical protein ACFFWC_00080 [Plantactinospora siamensis]|uniref:GNAT family N-acetyltransferase n=1 Tax=Plantactinospora siamensis TaxID=555372 RepID=A0ABV6NU83_9ACTN
MSDPIEPAALAARNNAEWCAAVCRTHDLDGAYAADAWTVARRSPSFYPDAVTLRPAAGPDLLTRIDAGAGASVKDSFAALDLAGAGFTVLFDAEWLHRAPGGPAAVVRRPAVPVTTPAALAGWAAAHGGGDVFRPGLLADPTVTLLAMYDAEGAVAGGAAVNRTGPVAGVSNVFAVTATPDEVWAAVLDRFPDVPLVGYESGADLAPPLRLGFRTVGPLRVWLRD